MNPEWQIKCDLLIFTWKTALFFLYISFYSYCMITDIFQSVIFIIVEFFLLCYESWRLFCRPFYIDVSLVFLIHDQKSDINWIEGISPFYLTMVLNLQYITLTMDLEAWLEYIITNIWFKSLVVQWLKSVWTNNNWGSWFCSETVVSIEIKGLWFKIICFLKYIILYYITK